MESPEWSIDAASQKLGLAQSTAYDYFKDLLEAGLLVRSRTGYYVIGPAVIVYDRLTRSSDPTISLAQPLMRALIETSGVECVALLCRLYRMTVLCVAQEASAKASFALSYERGRPMPLFRGAASKAILAHIELRRLRRYYDESSVDIARAGLGNAWREFKTSLRRLRATNVCVTFGELDVGRVGISAPVFSADGEILGSVSLVVAERVLRTDGLLEKLTRDVENSGKALTDAIRTGSQSKPYAPAKKPAGRKPVNKSSIRKKHTRRR